MAIPVIMPKQGQSVESCIISEWYKKKGDAVKKGEPLFVFETDKASFEEECPEDGTLLEIFFNEGDEVPVLTNVAVIGKAGEDISTFKPGEETSGEKEYLKEDLEKNIEGQKATEAKLNEDLFNQYVEKDEIKISPRAKNLAYRKGINYNILQGSGPLGRIIERDIISAVENLPKLTPLAKKIIEKEKLTIPNKGSGFSGTITKNDLNFKPETAGNDFIDIKLTNIRKVIAKAMQASLQNSAQLTHHLSADARKIITLRNKIKLKVEKGFKYNITLNDILCYAVIKALKKYPDVNAHFLGESIRLFKKVHLGLAVDTERGLMVPSILNADDLSLPELSVKLKEAAESCKKGNINPDLLIGTAATFTVTNLGSYGVEMFTPVLNLPQVGILGINTIVKRPAELEDGNFGFIPFIGLSLTYDHRALDGGPATKFLAGVKNEIENFDINII